MEYPNINTGLFWSTFTVNPVTVTKQVGDAKTVVINFPPVTGVNQYSIYGSLSPSTRQLITVVQGNPPFYIKIPVSNIVVPEEVIFHFWVSYTRNGQEIFINSEPSIYHNSINNYRNLFDKLAPKPISCNSPVGYARATIPFEMFEFIFNEIRRRHVTMMEIGGEKFILFQRRLNGPICPVCSSSAKVTGNVTQIHPTEGIPFDPTLTTEQNSPRYQGQSNCEVCFGTGILGGYYYPINLKISYQTMPSFNIVMQEQGLEFQKKPDAWSLWTPIIKQHDILHRVLTGERFVVKETRMSTWQGHILRIALSFASIPANDVRIKLTKESLLNILTKYNVNEEYIEVIPWL